MIPTHITLHGDAFLVTRATEEELVDAWADTDFTEHTMRVEDKADDKASLRFLGHEVVHIALHHSGVDQYMEDNLEEAVCWAVGHALVDFIRENPAFVEAVREAYQP
jgi:hypothetical protein